MQQSEFSDTERNQSKFTLRSEIDQNIQEQCITNDLPQYHIQEYNQTRQNKFIIKTNIHKYSCSSNKSHSNNGANGLARSKSLFQNQVKIRSINSITDYLKFTILIVDDNSFNIYALEQKIHQLVEELKNIQLTILTACNGQEALKYFKKRNLVKSDQNIQIILMDWEMPIMNGQESSQYIRKLIKNKGYEDTIIIACTADINMSFREKNTDFDYQMEKNFELSELKDIILKHYSSIIKIQDL